MRKAAPHTGDQRAPGSDAAGPTGLIEPGALDLVLGWDRELLPHGMRRGLARPALVWDTGRGIEIEMVHVPPDDGVPHGFWIGRRPVLESQFSVFARTTKRKWRRSLWSWATGDGPVTAVSWDDAHEFCEWVGLELPTDAEWRRAAAGLAVRPATEAEERETMQTAASLAAAAAPGYAASYAPLPLIRRGGRLESSHGALDLLDEVTEWRRDVRDREASAGRKDMGFRLVKHRP